MDWDRIVREDGPAVWRAAQRLVGNAADADECFQEAFAAAVVFSRQRPVRQWRALLVRLAVAKAIDRLRQRLSRLTHEVPGVDVSALPDSRRTERPGDRAEQAEMAERLRLALAHLPPKQADVFCLCCLEGYSYRDAGETLDISVDEVGVLVHRARAALRERIAWIISQEALPADCSRNRSQASSCADEVSQ